VITRRKSRMVSEALASNASGSKARGRYTFDSGTSSGGSGGLRVPTGNVLSFAAGSSIEFHRKNDRIQGPGRIELNGVACRPIEVKPHKDNPDGFFGGFWVVDAAGYFDMDIPDNGDFIFRFARLSDCRKDQSYNDNYIGRNGSGIVIYRNENTIIEDCYFINCTSDANSSVVGGAIYINCLNPSQDPPGTDWSLERCKFRDCYAEFLGGGFYLSHHSAGEEILDTDFERCTHPNSVPTTADTSADTMSYDVSSVSSVEEPIDGSQVTFDTDGTLPSPLVSGKIYYVTNAVKNVSVQVCLTRDDAIAGTNIIDITDTGSGNHTISPYLDTGVYEEQDLHMSYT